jgi:Tryptophan synthase alpha chain
VCAQIRLRNEMSDNVNEIKEHASVPTLAGLGIKSVGDASLLSHLSDGIILRSSSQQMIAPITQRQNNFIHSDSILLKYNTSISELVNHNETFNRHFQD